MPRTHPSPTLAATRVPAQPRGTATYERILAVTAATLAEVGIERLSTNLVCERAGVSPPALYRYFPNKYALLAELGQRLMQRQNECVARWITPAVLQGDADTLAAALDGLIRDTYTVTRDTPGGVWIMRALRAVPALQTVRLASHAQVTAAQQQALAALWPGVPQAELHVANRVVVELIYATVEMLFDEPMDLAPVARTVAGMLASHLPRLRPDRPAAAGAV